MQSSFYWSATTEPSEPFLNLACPVIFYWGRVVGHPKSYEFYVLPVRGKCYDFAADFASDTISGSAPLTVNFTDQSCGTITSWSWDFGDGSTSLQQNPSHTYTNPGTYTVSLTVTGPSGSDEKTEVDFISVSQWTRRTMPFIPLLLLDN